MEFSQNVTDKCFHNASFERPWDDFKFNYPGLFIVSMAYTVVFIFGLINNTLVVIAIFRTKELQNVTNFFIVSLAFSDILVCILMPATLMANLHTGKNVLYSLVYKYESSILVFVFKYLKL